MDLDPFHTPSSYPSQPSPSLSSSASSSPGTTGRKRSTKTHVPTACVNCKKAHLACDVSRPCKRCITAGKTDSCYDIQHKKRGRPKLRDQRSSAPWKHAQIVSGDSSMNAFQIPPVCYLPVTQKGFVCVCVWGYVYFLKIFLSLDMRCARVSDESLEMIGLHPQELLHSSLYEWIAPESSDVLARMHRCLLSVRPPHSSIAAAAAATEAVLSATSDVFVTHSPSVLLSIANGSQTFKEKLAFKRPDGSSQVLDARLYLGGGLGADLFLPATLGQLYIVCLLTASVGEPSKSTTPPSLLSESPGFKSRPSAPVTTSANHELPVSRRYHPPRQRPQQDPAKARELRSHKHPQEDTPHHPEQHQLIWMQPHDTVYHHLHHDTSKTPSTTSLHSHDRSY
ncbi:hypothetical protein BX666DRAFT_1937785 [Dichotomocladium elegans]|nr:hypothetical protein BX666DRAFT_1937785 [Dichotomocladium elegans]